MSQHRCLIALALISLCGTVYSSCVRCPDVSSADTYYVHMVPHSHMDLGWLKTVDQYFYGSNQEVTKDAVQYIYDSVLEALTRDTSRRFIFVESGFLDLWWSHRDNRARGLFTQLLTNGQIEFIGGGYVMNDEAAAHYINIIKQMTHGLNYLSHHFGDCGSVKTAWQIDPFGHSKEFASILQQMGFTQLFFGRIDYQEKQYRQKTQNMEFLWKFDDDRNITVSVLPNNYAPPSGFCFDSTGCNDDVLVDDIKSKEYNIASKADAWMKWVEENSNYYRTNHLIVTMGEDFMYENAHRWYQNMDILMNYINNANRTITKNNKTLTVKLVYSTPSCYLDSAEQKLSVNEDDFFPYANPDGHSYWTGYFSSRPAFKYLVRTATNFYQSLCQILATQNIDLPSIDGIRRALSIAQHHDAITGTAKQHVNDDYVSMISDGVNDASKLILNVIDPNKTESLQFCTQLNVSYCESMKSIDDGVTLLLYNPLSFNYTANVRIPVPMEEVEALDEGRNTIESVTYPIPENVLNLAERPAGLPFEITFPVHLRAMEFRQVIIRKSSAAMLRRQEDRDRFVISRGKDMRVGIGQHGIRWIKSNGVTSLFRHRLGYYKSVCSNNSRSSGAYVFRPDGDIVYLKAQKKLVVDTGFYTEHRTYYTDKSYLAVRTYLNQYYIEFDWVIGPINVSDNIGKEYVLTLDSDIQSNATFYTDSNGRDRLERIRDHRRNWNLTVTEPISGNYYPINSMISLSDSTRNYTLLTDRAQGASSIRDGNMQVMLHRRCLCDDHFGVNEALNEPGVDGKGLQVRGTFRLFTNKYSRKDDLKLTYPPMIIFNNKTKILNSLPKRMMDLNLLQDVVHVAAWEKVIADRSILTLEYIELSGLPISIDLNKLFYGKLKAVQETNLAGFKWHDIDPVITMKSKEIRTFLIHL